MASSEWRTNCFLSLFFYIIVFHVIIPHATPLSFNFNFSNPDTYGSNINLQSNATMGSNGIILTMDIASSTGRAVYNNKVLLWDNATGKEASFHTSFSFVIETTVNTAPGDGLAFFLSPYPSEVPRFDGGGYLGLFDNGNALANSTQNHLVAVEFDTFQNYWDPSDYHIGINVNSINSTVYRNLPGSVGSYTSATASIDYNSTTNNLSISLSLDDGTSPFNLSYPVDLKAILPQEVAAGFSAATGEAVEVHRLLDWNFYSTLERKSNLVRDNAN